MDTIPLLPDSWSPTPVEVVDDIVGFLIQNPERSFAEVVNPNVGSGLGGLGIDRGDTVVKLSVTGNPFYASLDADFQFERNIRIGVPQDQKDVLGLEAGMVGISPSRIILHHNPKIGYESRETIKDAGSHTTGSRELRTRAHLELTPMNIRGTRDPQRTGGGIGEAVMGGFSRAAPEFGTQVSGMFDTSDNLTLNDQVDSHVRLALFKRKPEHDYRTHWQTEDEGEGQVDNGNCKEDEKEDEEEIAPAKLRNKTPLPSAPRLERLKISLGEEIADSKGYLEGCLVYDDFGRKVMGYKLDPF
ncbi:uncharacterized protein LAJ45_01623 [Morchella importuna]|uniref:uncharacterized protein n=1 Tax=Morchella importuna TaxID=1174673 RepID=UPI001E8E6117|nr:uncharacterized protein LAJ45_01623 [Morchella importuna]KAH8153856.1 hypothetical protein LAJ45_01623 [Morchella importuna]